MLIRDEARVAIKLMWGRKVRETKVTPSMWDVLSRSSKKLFEVT